MIYITECSVGEMQKLGKEIPLDDKIEYVNKLISVGFEVLDFGCFNIHIPELISKISKGQSTTKIAVWGKDFITIEQILKYPNIDMLNFLLSHKNEEEFKKIQIISELIEKEGKVLNIYYSILSNFEWRDFITCMDYCKKNEIHNIHIFVDDVNFYRDISLLEVFQREYSDVKFGIRFYDKNQNILEILKYLYQFGVHKFDIAMKGLGGYLPLEMLMNFIMKENIPHHINVLNLESSWNTAKKIFKW